MDYTLSTDSSEIVLAGTTVDLTATRTLSTYSGPLELNQGINLLLHEDSDIFVLEDGSSVSLEDSIILESVEILYGHMTAAASGTYTLTGKAVTFSTTTLTHYTIAANSGAVSINGKVVKLLKGFKLASATNAFALAGTSVSLARIATMPLSSGTVNLSGTAVGTLTDYLMALSEGQLLFDNKVFNFNYNTELNYSMDAEFGPIGLTGTDITQKFTRKLFTESGYLSIELPEFTFPLGFHMDYTIDTESGAIALTGSDVGYTLDPAMPSISLNSGIFKVNEPYMTFHSMALMSTSPCYRNCQSIISNQLTYQIEVSA